MTSSLTSLPRILSAPEVLRLVAETGPWWLWSSDATTLVASNAAGARAMGATGLAPALARSYAGSHAFAGQVARIAPLLPSDGTPRMERLRIAGRFGSESVVAEAFRVRIDDAALVAIRLPTAGELPSREAVLALVADLRVPALAFTATGLPLAASDAAHPLAGTALKDLVGAKTPALLDTLATTGRGMVDLVNGPMDIVAVPGTDLLLAFLTPATSAAPEAGLRLVAATADAAPAPGTATEISEAASLAADTPAPSSTTGEATLEPPPRFSWKMDADTRFHTIVPDEVAGPSGLTLAEAAERFGLDPDQALTRAVLAERPFSGVPANWPLGLGRRRLAVTLAAFPAQRDGSFQGYAGFGLVVEEAPPAPEAPVAEETATSAPTADTTTPGAATADGLDADTAAVAPASEGPVEDTTAPVEAPAEAPAATEPPDARTSGEPRPLLTVVTTPPNVVALRSTVGQDPKRQQLSPGERSAFREIARALGARTEDGGTAAPAPLPPPAEQGRLDAPVGDNAGAPPAETPPTPVTESPATAPGDRPAGDIGADAPPTAPTTESDGLAPADGPSLVPDTAAVRATGPTPAPEPTFIESGTPHGPLPSAFASVAAATAAPEAAALLDKVPAGLVVHRGNAILFANRTLLDWVGFSSADALEEAGGIARLFAGRSDEHAGAMALTTASGEDIAVEAHLARISWAGEPASLFTLTRPTEAPAEPESATLTELRGRLDEVEQILDTATDGIVVVNADASIESMNRSAEALFGYESAEVKGRPITALFAPESHRSALDYCDGLLSNGVASVLNDGRQIIGRVKQGGLIPLYMTMGRTGPAARPKLAAVFRDMTHWKKAEEDLIAAKRQAELASSQKSDFLAKISHEIRTPLNAIIGFSEVMMEERFGPIGNERYRDYLKDIHASGGHVLSLINDLLDLSKIEAGKLELSFTSVDLNDMIQSSVAIMQPQANRDRVIIRSSLQPRLPNVVADSRSLRQIVLNLLSNAVKFTPAGGQIIISTGLSDLGEAVLRVRDTGIGMTETELKAAMEPFRQVLTASPRGARGTGLGLPLTKALVEANRASFGISSAPNQGTLVEVVFPPTRVLAE